MNFFEQQELARRNTRTLVVLFIVSVCVLGAALYPVIRILSFAILAKTHVDRLDPAPQLVLRFWDPMVFAEVMAGTLAFVGLVSFFRMMSLSAGGSVVAEMLGGRAVDPGTHDVAERRLLNVIEEMAIASGTPVPRAYVLDGDTGINAFAAGFTPSDAAIAVTRGALDGLTRDQLQGVIGHEFSHVLNGDMRLNLRMMGVLFGILAIAVVGRMMMSVRGRSKEGGALVIGGLALLGVGYVGVFMGRILQGAISRQREFLADASAVQFTRNPVGIAGALKRIAGLKDGSVLGSHRASEAAHLFFSDGIQLNIIDRMFATHPPIGQRILRLDPDFDGQAVAAGLPAEIAVAEGFAAAPATEGTRVSAAASPARVGAPAAFAPVQQLVNVAAASVVDRVGRLDAEGLETGANTIATLPADVLTALRDPEGAAHVVCAMLLDPDLREREKQVAMIRDAWGEAAVPALEALLASLGGVDAQSRLPLVELAIPALRHQGPDARAAFRKLVDELIASDRRVSLFEFVVQRLLDRRLREERADRVQAYRSLDRVVWNAAHLLAAVAKAGQPGDPSAATRAFQAGLARLQTPLKSRIAEAWANASLGDLEAVGAALDRLSLATPQVKRAVVDALAHCVMADGVVSVEESELLRVVSVSIDCPMAPFRPTRG